MADVAMMDTSSSGGVATAENSTMAKYYASKIGELSEVRRVVVFSQTIFVFNFFQARSRRLLQKHGSD